MKKNTQHLTVADMKKRFQIEKAETIRKWANDTYRTILRPMKIGNRIYFAEADVKRFEDLRRTLKVVKM